MSKTKYYDQQGREIVDMEFEIDDGSAMLMSAVYMDDGSQVPEEQLLFIEEKYPERLEEAYQDACESQADMIYERMKYGE